LLEYEIYFQVFVFIQLSFAVKTTSIIIFKYLAYIKKVVESQMLQGFLESRVQQMHLIFDILGSKLVLASSYYSGDFSTSSKTGSKIFEW